MVSQRLIVSNLMGEFHIKEQKFLLFSKVPRVGFVLSFNPEWGACYQFDNIDYYQKVLQRAYNTGGKDFLAETMLQILEKIA